MRGKKKTVITMVHSPPLNNEIREEQEENLNNTNGFIPNFEF